MPFQITVAICTHNPDIRRLTRTLEALSQQTYDLNQWELLLIDNASTRPIQTTLSWHPHAKVIHEESLGLTHARKCAARNARAEIIIFIDDDNICESKYLENASQLMNRYPDVGALGGKVLPEFQSSPPPWVEEFLSQLACRDFGENHLLSSTFDGNYPHFSPIGAGMVIRRKIVTLWAASDKSAIMDRQGNELSSGGDNDIIFHALKSGWKVAWFPQLQITHLIPSGRTTINYLARLNYGIQKSWMNVLSTHDCNPWGPIPKWTTIPRKMKAWFTFRAWKGQASYIHWKGACGHFDGREQYIQDLHSK